MNGLLLGVTKLEIRMFGGSFKGFNKEIILGKAFARLMKLE
jgi:hypothetical protein